MYTVVVNWIAHVILEGTRTPSAVEKYLKIVAERFHMEALSQRTDNSTIVGQSPSQAAINPQPHQADDDDDDEGLEEEEGEETESEFSGIDLLNLGQE